MKFTKTPRFDGEALENKVHKEGVGLFGLNYQKEVCKFIDQI
jgi:hypothetical protein